MRISSTLFVLLFVVSFAALAQDGQETQNASYFETGVYLGERPSLAAQIAAGDFIESKDIHKIFNPKKRGANKAVPGKGLPHGNDPLWEQQIQANKTPGKAPILTFTAAAANATPTDPTGAVGPDHFINSWNSSFRIWDKEGNALTSPTSLGAIFPGETSGDPIVMYDPFADRFVITEFSFSNSFLVAVCQGPDPVNDGWHTYEFATGNGFPDYPKYSIWSDGYYITANIAGGNGEVVFALERDKMLTGDASAQIIGFQLTGLNTNGFYSPLGFNVAGGELPPAGDAPICYMQDDSWSGVSNDHLKIWNINVNWSSPGSSTISSPQQVITADFDGLFDGGSFSNLEQPSGPDMDALQATIMYMAQYLRFPDHNSVVLNFVVDLDGGDDLAGIRWYELRQDDDGDDWEIYQEGTYAQPDGLSAFCGNICMDIQGNIALAYTSVSSTSNPSLRYTGRYAGDPLGTMTIAEELIVQGTQSDPSFRYGDYSQMTLDPDDEKTFWSIGEYFESNTRKDCVGVFKFGSDFADDVGVISIDEPTDGVLGATEAIIVTIRNYGTETQSDIPVSFQVDGGAMVDEVFAGPLASNEDAQYTFTTTADLSTIGATYTIYATTNLGGDEDESNDDAEVDVMNLDPNDIGVIAITAPVSAPSLGDTETVTITIENFGGAAQSDFDVTYTLDGAPVTEQVAGPLAGGATTSYSFAQTANFSALGDYNLSATTSLPGDIDTSNDEISVVITKEMCAPVSDCGEGDGFTNFQIGTINNTSGCSDTGYSDFTSMSTDLDAGAVHDWTVTTGYGDQNVKAWIDFNDNFVFEDNELVAGNYIIAVGEAGGEFTETVDLSIAANAAQGEHLLRGKSSWQEEVPGPCDDTDYGETEDYTVEITPVGVEEHELGSNSLVIATMSNNQFDVSFSTTTTNEVLIITVHNELGQKVIQNRVYPNNGEYRYQMDMSYAASGLYLVRLGSYTSGKVQRIVVQ